MCSRPASSVFANWKLFSAVALLTAGAAVAAEPAKKPGPNEPMPQTRTFFIDGVKTEADVKAIADSVMKVTSVTKVDQLSPTSGYANITFDHHAVTHQQIAQAIADAGSFQATFRFVIPEYAASAAKIDAIFAKVRDEVEITATNKEKGEFTLRFLPLKKGASGPHGIGFNLGKIGHPLGDPAPKGVGVKMTPVSKVAPARPATKKPAAKKAATK
jgi:copper chaperone CopZ